MPSPPNSESLICGVSSMADKKRGMLNPLPVGFGYTWMLDRHRQIARVIAEIGGERLRTDGLGLAGHPPVGVISPGSPETSEFFENSEVC
jgi:hypothetical protein